MHDILTVGLPILSILFGILWNQQGLRDARADIRDLKSDMNAQFRSVETDMNGQFRGIDTRLDRMHSDHCQVYPDLGRLWCANRSDG